MSTETLAHPSLFERWETLKSKEPQVRIRDAAARLGTSEATLLSLLLGRGVRRLRCEPGAILPRLEALGELMALTRNQAAVHERHGVYSHVNIQGNVGLIANPDIDLRLDFSVWAAAFAEVKAHHDGRTLRSLQFFDAEGGALHKIYAEREEQADAWEALVVGHLHEDQTTVFQPAQAAVPSVETPLDEAARAALVEAWRSLKDPHYFHGLLRKNHASRRQAFAAAEGVFTRRVSPSALRTVLGRVSSEQVPIMVFVANTGAVQIHTGTVSKILPMGSWINVMDEAFNLHVDLGLAAEAWVVSKPSPDGDVTSLELLSSHGELIVQLFGKRKPGTPERAAWTAVANAL